MSVEGNAEQSSIMSAYSRRGEKMGWVGGWTGGFLWVLALAVIRLVQGDMLEGMLGVLVFLIAEALVVGLAPWHFPTIPYFVLMLPMYVLFLISSCWAVWSMSGPGQPNFTYGNLFLILPVLLPLISIGRRRWQDGEPQEK